ncbi:unnamed protein product [Soboliphyme baturini]|uniref:Secreted protein n=1 Tax=Soboliphyme baturini TaxID=241478 RepID=A0A183ICA4_9BILA|nr:unnamed protein product [Soboliphyme baturini]
MYVYETRSRLRVANRFRSFAIVVVVLLLNSVDMISLPCRRRFVNESLKRLQQSGPASRPPGERANERTNERTGRRKDEWTDDELFDARPLSCC